MIIGSLSLVLKLQDTPDLHHVHDALNLARKEATATATATNTTESLQSIKVELKHTLTVNQCSSIVILQRRWVIRGNCGGVSESRAVHVSARHTESISHEG